MFRRNRRRYPIFTRSGRGPATTAGGLSAPWTALADLGMSLGIEGGRRDRVGEHHMTLENERDRQQEPAFPAPNFMVRKAHARLRATGSQKQVMGESRHVIVIDGKAETNRIWERPGDSSHFVPARSLDKLPQGRLTRAPGDIAHLRLVAGFFAKPFCIWSCNSSCSCLFAST